MTNTTIKILKADIADKVNVLRLARKEFLDAMIWYFKQEEDYKNMVDALQALEKEEF